MNLKISEKDIKTLKLGALGIVAIVILLFAGEGYSRWKEATSSYDALKDDLDLLDVSKANRDGLLKIVPAFNMPDERETQRFLVRDRLDAQLREIGINGEPLSEEAIGKSPLADFQLLRWKSSGTCTFDQMLELLTNLKENEYLMGIEEIRITVGSNSQQRNGMQTSRQGAQSAPSARGGAGGQRGGTGGGGGRGGRQIEYELIVSALAQ